MRKYAEVATDAILDKRCHLFSTPGVEGFIAYRLHLGVAVVTGDPVCHPADRASLATAFHTYCAENKLSYLYLIASSLFKEWAQQALGLLPIQYGNALHLDPQKNPLWQTGEKASLLRRKIKKAEEGHLKVRECKKTTPKLEEAMESVYKEWLQDRRGFQVHISYPHLFEHTLGKRWFVVKQQKDVLGVLVLNRVDLFHGWLMNHVMVRPKAPMGTAELLVVKGLEVLAKEGVRFVSFGNTPLDCLPPIEGIEPYQEIVAQKIFSLANRLMQFGGTRLFWEKFQPEEEPSYLLFNAKRVHLRALLALLRALNLSFRF